MSSLDIIIVNWNAGEQLQSCVRSTAAAQRESFCINRLVVVDNGSSDGSVDELVAADLPLVVLRNSTNRGFAAACNQAARGSAADYLLFLNPDVVIEGNSLEVPLVFMQQTENAHIGICGIQLLDSAKQVARSCARFPRARNLIWISFGLNRISPVRFPGSALEEWDHQASGFVDHVIGAFFLVRRTLFESLGGFDERFFVYLEDLDFSYRAHQTGWRSYFLSTARATHRGGGCSEQILALRLFYSQRSRILFVCKHFSWFGAALVSMVTVLVEPFSRLAWSVLTGSVGGMRDTLRAYAMLWTALPEILTKRRRERLNVQSAGTD